MTYLVTAGYRQIQLQLSVLLLLLLAIGLLLALMKCAYALTHLFSWEQADEADVIGAMKLSDVRKECEWLGLRKRGNKPELIALILETKKSNKVRVTHARTHGKARTHACQPLADL